MLTDANSNYSIDFCVNNYICNNFYSRYEFNCSNNNYTNCNCNIYNICSCISFNLKKPSRSSEVNLIKSIDKFIKAVYNNSREAPVTVASQ